MNDKLSRLKHVCRPEAALLYVVAAIILWLAIEAWFNPLQFRVFAGDDLATFSSIDQTSSGPDIRSLALTYHKFRPVAAWIIFLIAKWTHCDFRAIASIGIAIHAANAILFFSLLYRTIKVPLSLSVGLTVVAIFNRFATYLFMQDEAIMEGVAITLFLCLLRIALSLIERPTILRSFLATLLFGLVVYVHERYLVLAVPLALLSFGIFTSNRKASVTLVTGVTAAALSYLCIKRFWLDAPILVGTGGQSIDFSVSQICSFAWHGALNLVGINRGPAHLSLEDFPDSPFWIRFVSIAAAISSCSLLAGTAAVIILSPSGRQRMSGFLRVGFYVLTAAVLVIAASATVRQEYRWVYPAYLAFLCLLGYGVSLSNAPRSWFYVALTSLVVFSLCREIYLTRRFPQFFAFGSYQIANNLFAALQHAPKGAQYETILLRGEVPHKGWVFLGGAFSRFYRLPSLEFSAEDAPIGQTDESRLVLDYVNSERTFRIAREAATVNAPFHRMDYSVLERSAAALRPDDRWATPTKTPLFLMSKNGVDCLAVVAPVKIDLPVPPGARVFYICFSHIYAMGDGADVEIAAIGPAGPKPLLSRAVPPLVNGDLPVWRKYEFALPADIQEIELHVFSKTDPTADWIAVRDFSFN